ncbi:PucR family transcriptional regulator [Streptomyces sp. NPDC004752]
MSFAQVVKELVSVADRASEETYDRVWGTVGYDEAHLQRDEISRWAAVFRRAEFAALTADGPVEAAALEAAREIGANRALQGVPIESVMHSWMTGERIWVERLVAYADRLAPEELSSAIQRISKVMGEISRHAIEEYRRTQAEVTVHYDQLATDLVAQLVGGRLSEPDDVERRARAVGSRAFQTHTAVVMTVPTTDPAVHLRLERHLLAAISGATDGRILVGRVDDQQLLLCPLPDTDPAALHARLHAAIDDPHRPGSVLLGTTTSTDALAGITAVCRRARLATEVGIRLGWSDRVVRFEDVAPEVLLLRGGDEVTDVLTDLLAPIRDRPELLATLRAYLRNGLSARAAARELYVHQNTVPQRLRTIERLLNRDLGDVNGLLDVLLAVRAMDLNN